MLREFLTHPPGYWLVTHPDHAHLAGEFAVAWGNETFLRPEPRAAVLEAIRAHDDGWKLRDAAPEITRLGKPSAFSKELVGKYSAFEEIDLPAYLSVRQRALSEISEGNPYAAILISKHTCDLLGNRADRSTISSADLPLLDEFLVDQLTQQNDLRRSLLERCDYSELELSPEILHQHFCLLQACDNLSLLACVDFQGAATLLHPLPTQKGVAEISVKSIGSRHLVLDPWPFSDSFLEFNFPARFVEGELFPDSASLRAALENAPTVSLSVRLSALE